MSVSAGPQSSFSHSALGQTGWQGGGGGDWPVLFWLPLRTTLYSAVLSNFHWQALWPSGSMVALCRWHKCPSTNISSELLDHVKSITAVLTAVPHACGSLIKVLELGLESREKGHINTSMRTRLAFTVVPNWFNKGRIAGLACDHLFWMAFQFC